MKQPRENPTNATSAILLQSMQGLWFDFNWVDHPGFVTGEAVLVLVMLLLLLMVLVLVAWIDFNSVDHPDLVTREAVLGLMRNVGYIGQGLITSDTNPKLQACISFYTQLGMGPSENSIQGIQMKI